MRKEKNGFEELCEDCMSNNDFMDIYIDTG